jgi:hypothetical protein
MLKKKEITLWGTNERVVFFALFARAAFFKVQV